MYNLDKGQKIDIELEKYVAPVPKKSMTMKERIDKAKTKLSEKKLPFSGHRIGVIKSAQTKTDLHFKQSVFLFQL